MYIFISRLHLTTYLAQQSLLSSKQKNRGMKYIKIGMRESAAHTEMGRGKNIWELFDLNMHFIYSKYII